MVFDDVDKNLKVWHLALFIVVAVALGAFVGLSSGPELEDRLEAAQVATGLPDMQFDGYEYEDVETVLTALDEDGRSYYATTHLIPDTIFAIFAFLAIASIVIFLTRPGQRFSVPLHEMVRLVIIAIAFAALFCDLGENLMLWIMIGGAPEPATAAVAAGNLLTGVKWLAYAGAFAALIATVIIAVVRGATSQEAAA